MKGGPSVLAGLLPQSPRVIVGTESAAVTTRPVSLLVWEAEPGRGAGTHTARGRTAPGQEEPRIPGAPQCAADPGAGPVALLSGVAGVADAVSQGFSARTGAGRKWPGHG